MEELEGSLSSVLVAKDLLFFVYGQFLFVSKENKIIQKLELLYRAWLSTINLFDNTLCVTVWDAIHLYKLDFQSETPL